MKKLIILVSLIALLASGMAFGQITWTGSMEFEMADDFDEDEGIPETGLGSKQIEFWEPDHFLYVNAKVDEFNSAFIRLRYNDAKNAGGNRYVYADKAVITTNFLGAFGVKNAPMTWVSDIGLNEWLPDNVSNLGWDITKRVLFNDANGKNDYFFDEKITGTKQTMTFADGMFKLGAFFGLADGADTGVDTLEDFFIDAVVGMPIGDGKLSAEIAYMKWEQWPTTTGTYSTMGTKMEEGHMMFGAAYNMKVNDIGLAFGGSYYMPMDTEMAYAVYGVNAKATIGQYYVLAGLQGVPENEDLNIPDQMLHNVRLAAGGMLTKVVGADVGLILYTGGEEDNLALDDRETLNTLDASIYFMAGKAKYRIGMLMVPEDDYSIDPYNTDAYTNSFYFLATLAF